MFESVSRPSASSGEAHEAARARLSALMPARPASIAEGPFERAQRLAPGVFRAPRRRAPWRSAGRRDEPLVCAPRSTSIDDKALLLGPEPRGANGPSAGDSAADMPGGPVSTDALARIEAASLSSHDLLEATARWDQLISWAQAKQSDLVAEFARRRPGPYAPDQPGRTVSEFAADEIAARLRVTRRAAELKLAIALDLAERLPATREALLEGRIDLSKARAIADHTAVLADAETRRGVEERVLRRAGSQTTSELRRSLLRAVAAVGPQAASKRHVKAKAGRFLRMHVLPDGMAEISALLPADDAMAIFTSVDTIARCADPADPRGIEARRADALVDVCRAVLTSGYAAPGHDEADAAGELARRGDRSARRRLARRRRSGPHIQVTVAATTLLGVDDQPAELAGYGPIPADVARRIAADPDATWRRLLTDPASGVLLDYGTTVYRPPPHLRDHVVARDQVCAFPGCRQPAERCDLDHREPFPRGPTCAANLGPLCRHHHRAKTEGGWNWWLADDGTITWVAPTGHTYESPTPPVLEHDPTDSRPAADDEAWPF